MRAGREPRWTPWRRRWPQQGSVRFQYAESGGGVCWGILILSGSPAKVRRSGGRPRHRNDAGATAHQHREKYEPTPPGRLEDDHDGRRRTMPCPNCAAGRHWATACSTAAPADGPATSAQAHPSTICRYPPTLRCWCQVSAVSVPVSVRVRNGRCLPAAAQVVEWYEGGRRGHARGGCRAWAVAHTERTTKPWTRSLLFL